MKPIILLFGIVGTLALLSCSASHPPSAPHLAKLPDTGKPALHAVSDAKLRELMDQMNSVMLERFLTQPEIDKERGKYAQQMLETAAKLDATIHYILARLPDLELNPTEQATFRALAHKLHEQAELLQLQVKQGRTDTVSDTVDQITNTCTSCHSLFRKLKS